MGIPQAAVAQPSRRSDAGHARLQQRDLNGLLLLADHYAAPYDLLAVWDRHPVRAGRRHRMRLWWALTARADLAPPPGR